MFLISQGPNNQTDSNKEWVCDNEAVHTGGDDVSPGLYYALNQDDVDALADFSVIAGGGFVKTTDPAASPITNLDGMKNLKVIAGRLDISNVPGLEKFSDLTELKVVWEDVRIVNNANLTTLGSMANIRELNLTIKDNLSLENLNGLAMPPGKQTDAVVISGNVSLNGLSGMVLPPVFYGKCCYIQIIDNPVLQSIEGLEPIPV